MIYKTEVYFCFIEIPSLHGDSILPSCQSSRVLIDLQPFGLCSSASSEKAHDKVEMSLLFVDTFLCLSHLYFLQFSICNTACFPTFHHENFYPPLQDQLKCYFLQEASPCISGILRYLSLYSALTDNGSSPELRPPPSFGLNFTQNIHC